MPSMRRYGYTDSLAAGSIAAGGTLGILIPPSVILVLYGIMTEQDIGQLFMAGILPGLLGILFYLGAVRATIWLNPKAGPPGERLPWNERFKALRGVWGVMLLFILVMGGIYGGVFSPTEAGAIGALGAGVIAAARRRLTWDTIKSVVLETGFITASILFLIISASLYSRMLALSSIPNSMTEFISALNLSLIGFCLAYMVLVILLGMILDSVSILLIVLPIALPVVSAFGGDPIWFGIISIIAVEVGLLTPPFGLSVFVVKGSLPDGFASLGDIFAGVAPYVVTMILFIILLILVPGIALVLL